MTPQQVYLICFVVGFLLALLGALGGTFHWPFGGHDGLHGFHVPHGNGASHVGGAHGVSQGAGHGGVHISPWNFATLMGFLAVFGGVGYLLSSRGRLGNMIVLAIALTAGFAGAALIFGFLTRVLLRHERFLDAADYDMVGVLGRVTVPIRAGGTGEVVYSQGGTRKSVGARAENGDAFPRGREVVVTRFERGIAYVRGWEELASLPEGADSPRSIE
jgi:membrane protein implicated in regulation of membrane protease activity